MSNPNASTSMPTGPYCVDHLCKCHGAQLRHGMRACLGCSRTVRVPCAEWVEDEERHTCFKCVQQRKKSAPALPLPPPAVQPDGICVLKPTFIKAGTPDEPRCAPVAGAPSSSDFHHAPAIFKAQVKDEHGRIKTIGPTPESLISKFLSESFAQSFAVTSSTCREYQQKKFLGRHSSKKSSVSRPFTLQRARQLIAVAYCIGIACLPSKADCRPAGPVAPTCGIICNAGLSRKRCDFIW